MEHREVEVATKIWCAAARQVRTGVSSSIGHYRQINSHCSSSNKCRYANVLNPKANRSPLTTQEMEKLLELQSGFGNKWKFIAKHFPGRYVITNFARELV